MATACLTLCVWWPPADCRRLINTRVSCDKKREVGEGKEELLALGGRAGDRELAELGGAVAGGAGGVAAGAAREAGRGQIWGGPSQWAEGLRVHWESVVGRKECDVIV